MLKLTLALSACVLTLSLTNCPNGGNTNTTNSNTPAASPSPTPDAEKSRQVAATLSEINGFAADVQRKMWTNLDTADGVDEAHALLNSRKEEMKAKVQSVKNVRDEELTKELAAKRGELLFAAYTGMRDQIMKNPTKYNTPAVKPKYERLLRDYEDTFRY